MGESITYNYSKYCLKHGHDWQPWYPKDPREPFTWEKCAICGARQLNLLTGEVTDTCPKSFGVETEVISDADMDADRAEDDQQA